MGTADAKALLEFFCPRCGKRNDSADPAKGDDARPHHGDIAVCIGCAAPLRLRAAQPPAWLTYDDVRAMDADQRGELLQAMLAIVTYQPSTLERRPWK